jgi:hypothetical protein
VPKVSIAETSLLSSSTAQVPLAVAVAFLDMFCHFLLHWIVFRPGTFAAMLAQLVVPNVSTIETSFFFSSTVQAPLSVVAAFLDIYFHLSRHWSSLRPGTFPATSAQLVVPKVSTLETSRIITHHNNIRGGDIFRSFFFFIGRSIHFDGHVDVDRCVCIKAPSGTTASFSGRVVIVKQKWIVDLDCRLSLGSPHYLMCTFEST